jgi:RHS repeat-associated protein
MVAINETYRKTLTPDRSAKDSGRRFYSAETSRWLSRDPIGERGGIHVYGFVGNSTPNRSDAVGLAEREETGAYSYDPTTGELGIWRRGVDISHRSWDYHHAQPHEVYEVGPTPPPEWRRVADMFLTGEGDETLLTYGPDHPWTRQLRSSDRVGLNRQALLRDLRANCPALVRAFPYPPELESGEFNELVAVNYGSVGTVRENVFVVGPHWLAGDTRLATSMIGSYLLWVQFEGDCNACAVTVHYTLFNRLSWRSLMWFTSGPLRVNGEDWWGPPEGRFRTIETYFSWSEEVSW